MLSFHHKLHLPFRINFNIISFDYIIIDYMIHSHFVTNYKPYLVISILNFRFLSDLNIPYIVTNYSPYLLISILNFRSHTDLNIPNLNFSIYINNSLN